MRIQTIRKKNGSPRLIYCPNPEEKAALRKLLPDLNAAALAADKHGVAHGFMPGRSAVTNAMAHRGHAYSLSFDLADWFDTVKLHHLGTTKVGGWVLTTDRDRVLSICFVDGAARQGLPTSPAIANIAAAPMDAEIMALRVRGRVGWNFDVYTRYADDLTFSFEREGTARWLMRVIPEIVERHGFKINPNKTRLQCAHAGRRMITGVGVDAGIHPPRYIKRKIRAAAHRMGRNPWSRNHHHGLSEWARLRPPAFIAGVPMQPITAVIIKVTMKVLNASERWLRAPFSRKFYLDK